MKILLVEDDMEISAMLKKFLMTENYEVIAVSDGESACEKFFSDDFGLVLLDLMIPKTNGMEVMGKIRESSTVPIIIISAKDTDSDKTLGLGLGADDYITKPFSVTEVLARIKKLNQEYPRRMRELGWDIEDCTIYDAEKVKDMTADEATAYKAKCKAKRQQKKSGLDSKTYKSQQELKKIEKEKDKARLSRDLAFAAAQQAKQQTSTTLQQKIALETDIANLQAKTDSYPVDLQEHLNALSAAANAYHNATNIDTNGPLIEFLHKIKVNQKKPDGSTTKKTVYDVWKEYQKKQEQKLAAQAEQARQGAINAQRRLPTFQSTATPHGGSHEMDF